MFHKPLVTGDIKAKLCFLQTTVSPDYRVTVVPADFSNYILGKTKCNLLIHNCLAGFNPSIPNDCPGRQLSRYRGINKKHLQEQQKCSNENTLILPPVLISAGVVTF